MKRRQTVLFSLILMVVVPGIARAQAWSGIIDPARAVDWSSAGVAGGIPSRTTICVTLNPGATVAQINSAISSCPSGQVVFLNSGTYNLTSGIVMSSNVTLRGAGANQTQLIFSGAASCQGGNAAICVNGTYSGSWWPGPPGPNGAPASQTRSWTGTNGLSGVYTKGATILNLASAPTGLQVGWTLMLSQNDDSAVSTTNLWVGGNCNVGQSLDGSGDTYGTSQQQNVKVTAINGTQVTISPGIYMSNWRTSQSPQVYWFGSPMTGVGIENLRLDTASAGVSAPIVFLAAVDSWVKGVSTTQVPAGARAHVRLTQSRNLAVIDSYFSGSGGSGQLNYGVESYDCSDCLIQNNIVNSIITPIMVQAGSTGLVVGYNYTIATGSGAHDIQLHQAGNAMLLVEGNASATVLADTFHGTNLLTTIFRNRLAGSGVTAIDIWANNRYYNILGNVLGTAGSSSLYESSNPSSPTSGWNSNIYRFGFPYIDAVTSYGRCSGGNINFDVLGPSSMLRWGNFDLVNNAARYVSAEVPTGLSQYTNALPASQALPASLYLPAKPSWWPATKPFPAVGPEVTGGNVTGVAGHAYTIPALDCFNSIGGNVANFSATTCYAQSGPPAPAPPASLAAIVH
jgi:hypothetical protein